LSLAERQARRCASDPRPRPTRSCRNIRNRSGRRLIASNSEARRLIKGGGARVNDAVVKGETPRVSLAELDPQALIKLSAGRKRHAVVRPS